MSTRRASHPHLIRLSASLLGLSALMPIAIGCASQPTGASSGTIAASVGPASSTEQPVSWVHAASGTRYPAAIGSFSFTGYYCYDGSGLDCSAEYEDQAGNRFTMYVFPVEGRYPGHPDPLEAEFRAAASQIQLHGDGATVSQFIWRSPVGGLPARMLEGETLIPLAEGDDAGTVMLQATLSGGAASGQLLMNEDPPGHWVALTPRSTYLVVSRVGAWFVKWRYTRRGAPGPGTGELAGFLSECPAPTR